MKVATSIYLVFGDDEYLVEQGLAKTISRIMASTPEEPAVEIVDCKETGIAGAIQEIASPSLFSVNKISVLKRFNLTGGRLAAELEGFVRTGLAQGQFLVLVPDKVDKRLRIVKSIRAGGGLVEVPRLSQEGLVRWVRDRFEQEGKPVSTGQARTIIDLKGDDLRGIDSEIEKILTYVGQAGKVTDEDIAVLVGRSRTEKVFDLIRQIALREVSAALETLADLLNIGESPIGIIFLLSRQVRWMIQARLFITSAGIAWDDSIDSGRFAKTILPRFKAWVDENGIPPADTFLRQHPYAVFWGFKESGGFDVDGLISMLERLLEANAMLVSTSAKAEVVLERFVASLGIGS
jgi:DNA polymerase-3 subunit delta